MRTRLLCLVALGALACGAAPAAASSAGSVSKQADGVTATLTYTRTGGGATISTYRDMHLTVRASGRTTLRRLKLWGVAKRGQTMRPRLRIAELSGDGVPDVIVDMYSGGAHCCSISAIVASTPTSWRAAAAKNWADHHYSLKDVGGTATPEFVTDDARFTAAYTSYAASASPIRIYSLLGGKLRVVTRQFPAAIRADEQQWAKEYADVIAGDVDTYGRREYGRSTTAARVADLVLVGDYAGATAVLAESRLRGDFTEMPGFEGQLGHDLVRWNYLPDPALIGLTNDPIE